jgi:DNA-directed RNA polymerase subunit RPC12/RpoP
MILRGERNREEKLKDIAEYKERKIKDDIEEAKRFHVLFVCQQCGLRISFEPKREGFSFSYMSYDFDDYREFFQEEPDYIPLEHNYKNIKSRYWGGPSSYICLDCGSGLFNEKMDLKVCEQCGSRSIVAGNDLCGKPCPVCGTEFGEAIELQGGKTYWAKVGVLKDEWWDIYREKYHVKKPIPPNYTKEEIDEQERRVTLMENYRDNSYALDSSHNVLRFEFDDAFFLEHFFVLLNGMTMLMEN